MKNIIENLKIRLQNSEEVILSNEIFQQEKGQYDIRMATLEFRDDLPSWANGFKITFNGELLHSSKTFKSFEKRLNKLIDKWDLKELI